MEILVSLRKTALSCRKKLEDKGKRPWCMIRSILGLAFFLITFCVHAQRIEFEYLGLRDGLSQVSVTSIIQDDIGRIWIGTRDGINYYDGDQIKIIRPVRGDSSSLLDHQIKSLKIIGNHIWAVSNQGISRLDLHTLKFKRFPFDGIYSVAEFEGRIFLGTIKGLFELDTAKGDFLLRKDIFQENTTIWNLLVDNAGILRICSEKGYYKYNPLGNHYENHRWEGEGGFH